MILLAAAGLAGEILNDLDPLGWFLPILFLCIPVSVVLLVAAVQPLTTALFLGQLAGIYGSLRAFHLHLRRKHFGSSEIKMLLAPAYLVLCLMTNLLITLAVLLFSNFR